MPDTDESRHRITRVRREVRRRHLSVTGVERLTSRMVRITFTSPDLAGFESAGHDDHVKLFLPTADGGSCMRDYTPRRFDPARRTLAIDFVLHEAGPATAWASAAAVGDTLEIGGPRGSTLVPDDFDWYLLVGDETALPAIGRRVEELRPGVPVMTAVAVATGDEAQRFATAADWTARWVCRDREGTDDAAALRRAIDGFAPPPGDGFVWIAAEARVARALRAHVVDARAHPPAWTRASGYWVAGSEGAHESFD